MTAVENIVRAYRSRQGAVNWAAWASEHPEENELLAWAARMKLELENGERG